MRRSLYTHVFQRTLGNPNRRRGEEEDQAGSTLPLLPLSVFRSTHLFAAESIPPSLPSTFATPPRSIVDVSIIEHRGCRRRRPSEIPKEKEKSYANCRTTKFGERVIDPTHQLFFVFFFPPTSHHMHGPTASACHGFRVISQSGFLSLHFTHVVVSVTRNRLPPLLLREVA